MSAMRISPACLLLGLLCATLMHNCKADAQWDSLVAANAGGTITIPATSIGNASVWITPRNGTTISLTNLNVFGTLMCDPSGHYENFLIRVGNVLVSGSDALFACVLTRKTPSFTIELTGQRMFTGGEPPENWKSIQVMSGARLILTGHPGRSTTKARLARTATAGSTEIFLRYLPPSVLGDSDFVSNWMPGDEIVVATTSFHRQSTWSAGNFSQLSTRYSGSAYVNQNERRIIDTVSPAANGTVRVVLTQALSSSHYGEGPSAYQNPQTGKWHVLDEAAHVVNLARTIRIRGGNGVMKDIEAINHFNGIGGHVIVHRTATAVVDSVEFSNLGQLGYMARYPFHWHVVGNGGANQVIKRSSLHDNFQRCITVHGTNHTEVSDNTCFNTYGHAFFLEDGIEMHNIIRGNIAIEVRKMPADRNLLWSDSFDLDGSRFPAPAAFWISHPWNNVTHNVAIASEGSGFWNSFVSGVCCVPTYLGDGKFPCTGTTDACGDSSVTNYTLKTSYPLFHSTLVFSDNEASSCRVGINWDAGADGKSADNPRNEGDKLLQLKLYVPPTVPVYSRLVMYKNSNRALYFRGQLSVYDSCIFADNNNAPLSAYETIMRDSVSIGWSFNAEAFFFVDSTVSLSMLTREPNGFRIYDGPLVLRRHLFAGFPSVPAVWSNPAQDVTPRLLTIEISDDRFPAVTENVSFTSPSNPYWKTFLPWPKPEGTFQTPAVYDRTGEYSGVVGGTFVSDTPFDKPDLCSRSRHQRLGLLCPNLETSTLYFRDSFHGGGSTPQPMMTIALGEGLGYQSPTIHSPLYSGGQMAGLLQNRNVSYHMLHWTLQSTPNMPGVHATGGAARNKSSDYLWMNLIEYTADTNGTVSPPFYFHSKGGCPHQLKFVSIFPHAVNLTEMSSLQELLTGTGASTGGVFYGSNYTVIRFRTRLARYCLDANQEPCDLSTRKSTVIPPDTPTRLNISAYPAEYRVNEFPAQATEEIAICCGDCKTIWDAPPSAKYCTLRAPTRVIGMGFTTATWPNRSDVCCQHYPTSPSVLLVRGYLIAACYRSGVVSTNENVTLHVTIPKLKRTVFTAVHPAGSPWFGFTFSRSTLEAVPGYANITLEDIQIIAEVDGFWIPMQRDAPTSWEFGPAFPGSQRTALSPTTEKMLSTDADIMTEYRSEIQPNHVLQDCQVASYVRGDSMATVLASDCSTPSPTPVPGSSPSAATKPHAPAVVSTFIVVLATALALW